MDSHVPRTVAPAGWSLTSWRNLPIKQQPKYADEAALEAALQEVRRLPPLVAPSEVDALRAQLAEVAEGKRFLLQGGDCAERFVDCASEPIEAKLRILLQMSLVLTWGARIPTLRIARMAGQFSKPRSKDTETLADGSEVTAFRGDNVNSFDLSARTPDPSRIVSGYFHSAATLNYARTLLSAGFADLHAASHWDLGFVQDAAHRRQYKVMVDRILSALDFMRVCGVGAAPGGSEASALRTVDFFVSHEGLQLGYEEALTRPVPIPTASASGRPKLRAPASPAVKVASATSAGSTSSAPGSASRPSPVVLPPLSIGGAAVESGAAAANLLGGQDSAGDGAFAGVGSAPHTPVHPPAAPHHEAHGKPPAAPAASVSVSAASSTGSARSRASSATSAAGGAAGASASSSAPPAAYYNLGTHFLWIGDRTRQLDHAHVEYCRGIANPVGVKVGPSSDPAELVALIARLWPHPAAQPGKIVLITRFGAGAVREKLPAVIAAVRGARFAAPVVWVCDPMHGNTRLVAGSGLKTREFDDILTELRLTFEVHREQGSRLGGVHFELTGENVTECVGGPEKLLEVDLPRRYTTYCDPRLNYAQSMEVAFLVAQYLAREREEELSRASGLPAEDFAAADDGAGFDEDGHGGAAAGGAGGSGSAGRVTSAGGPSGASVEGMPDRFGRPEVTGALASGK